MFELLAPVFAVAGGLMAGVPILLHLLRRRPAVRMPFSIVRFLTPTLPTTTKRATPEHWPLMLLRILAVLLIALAFSRPFQRLTIAKGNETASGGRIAILIDASASMRRDGIREAVLKEVQNVIAALHPQDTLSIATFSRTSKTVLSAAEWDQTEPAGRAALVERVLAAYEPDWMATATGTAMLEAADEVARERRGTDPDATRKVILITDFQEGSQLDELRSGTWPDSVQLDLRVMQPLQQGNAGLSLVADERTGKVRVRITNSGDAARTRYSLALFDSLGQPLGNPIAVDVGGGQRRTVTLPQDLPDDTIVAGVEILDEPHAFDNVVDLPVDDTDVVRVAHAGDASPNNPESMRYYLQRVLDGNEASPAEIVDLLTADGVAVPVPDDVRLAIVTETVPSGLVSSLNDLLARGGVVLVAFRSVEMAASLASLLPENAKVEEAVLQDYAMLGNMDFSSSLLTPFADSRFADFSSIRFWHHRKVNLDPQTGQDTRVVARFDNGSPAIIESPHASGGRLFVLTAGWHPDDSQWALSTRFPPMILRLLQIATPRQSGHRLLETGDRFCPADFAGQKPWTLTDPLGKPRQPDDATKETAGTAPTESETSQTASAPALSSKETIVLDTPGRWILTWDSDEGARSLTLLVTVVASESRTETLPAGQLQAMGMAAEVVSVKAPESQGRQPEDTDRLNAAELESKQKYWRWMLLAGLACLALEGLLAFAIERRHGMEPV